MPGPADTFARHYVQLNYPGVDDADITVVTPYDRDGPSGPAAPDPSKVEVTVHVHPGTFFGRVLGVASLDIERRAVAEKWEVPGNMAMFSYQHPLCSDGTGLEFNGNNMHINGLVHSNGQFAINGPNFWAADGTVSRNNCVPDLDDPPTSQFGPDPTACGGSPCNAPRDVFETLTWPVWYTPAQFGWMSGCTYHGQKITINDGEMKITNPTSIRPIVNRTIPTGTYCASETFELSGTKLKGTLTVVAREIKISGVGHEFHHFQSRVLFFALPNWDLNPNNDGPPDAGYPVECQNDKELVLNPEEYKWSGTLFSPCTRIVINGDDSSALEGTIVGYRFGSTATASTSSAGATSTPR